jgi:hypothetical protein
MIGAAYRAQADALEIELGAKRLLADDAAQERGEIPVRGGDRKKYINFEDAKLDGPTPTEIHDARTIRDAEVNDPEVIRRALDEKLAAGEEPTKASLRLKPPCLGCTAVAADRSVASSR